MPRSATVARASRADRAAGTAPAAVLVAWLVVRTAPFLQVTQDVAERGDSAVPAQDHIGDQAGPPGLVEGADRGAVVAVEVLAEDQVVLPGGVGLHLLGPAEACPPPVFVPGKQRDQPVLQVRGDPVEGEPLARAGRVLDLQVIAVEPVVALQRVDHEIVDREPDRAAPVGVAPEHGGGGLGRLVVDGR